MRNPSKSYQELLEENSLLKKKIKELAQSEAQRTRPEENLRASGLNYQAVFETTGTAMLIIEEDMTISLVNHAFEILTGYAREEVKRRKKWMEFVGKDDLKKMIDCHQMRRAGSSLVPKSYEFKLTHKDGYLKNVLLTIDIIPGTKRSIASLMDITDHKQTEEKLRESENRFRAIANYAADWESWVGPEGKLLWVNPMVFDFTGYTVEECLNMPGYPLPVIDKADRKRMSQLFLGAKKGSSGSNIECRIICKDGRRKWIGISWRPIYDKNGCNIGYRTSIRDISSRKSLEDNLRDAKERLEATINALPDLMFRVDQDGYISACHSLDDNLNYVHPTLFLGKNFFDVLPDEASGIIKDALDKAGRQGISRGFSYSLPMEKGLSWYECSIARMGEPKKSGNNFIMLVRNITDRKHAEEELRKAYEQLETRVQERTADLAKAVDELRKDEQMLSANSQRLQETNTALKVLLEHRQEDQSDLERKFLSNIRNLVLPYMEKLSLTGLTHAQAGYVDIITTNLNNITSSFLRNLAALYMDFTPREIEIANLVREGKSAKEIALLLSCSDRSIEFHKDNIRRKLGLTHKKTNLRTYLLSLAKTSC